MSAAIDSTSTTARHPARELLARYGAIFKAAWAHRDQLAGPKRLADERAFLPATLALQETPPHPAPRRAIIVICSLFVIALLWAIFGKIEHRRRGAGPHHRQRAQQDHPAAGDQRGQVHPCEGR